MKFTSLLRHVPYIQKGEISIGIDVCCSVADVWLIIIHVSLVSWATGEFVMHVYVWLQVAYVWMSCICSLVG